MIITSETVKELIEMMKSGHEFPPEVMQQFLNELLPCLIELEAQQQLAALVCLDIDLLKKTSEKATDVLLQDVVNEVYQRKERLLQDDVERTQRYTAYRTIFQVQHLQKKIKEQQEVNAVQFNNKLVHL